MSNIRTAILGYGRSGSSMHADAMEKNPSFEVVAVADIDPARRDQAGERFGCALYDDYRQMLAAESLDLVSIVTRSDQHCYMTCDCLGAGVNVVVTKPWAVNAAEAQRMVEAAKTSGQQLIPWLPARWAADLARLKELRAERAIGNIFLVRRTVSSFGTRNDWQTEKKRGGGYILNWGPHIVDPPLLLMDSPVRSVYARKKQVMNPGDAEDMFMAVLTLESGAIVQVEYALAVEDLPSWFVQGDEGTIVLNGHDLTIHHSVPVKPDDPTQFSTMKSLEDEKTEERVEGEHYGEPVGIYAEIAQSLRGERPFPVAPEDALALSRVLEAIHLSADEDRVVRL